ncbi:UxaA family hydrolase [Acetanaerobacterium elongatum]|uniref:D-altronate dehydratase n=1 Tax=Acetanaerobacterium elongatum TaxID=258515 RepID=A0A1H0DRR8_9FIRM|nr:altronate dehydratase family protein [Acetanaerobacterium elongatum]SDN72768.1 D-altronate dehydratase [Acetanaerobacterium elongatum]
MSIAIKINPKDNVAVALTDLSKGTKVDIGDRSIILAQELRRGHKFSLTEIKRGEDVIKYGFPIGHATQDIPCGSVVHSHNIKTNLDTASNHYTYSQKLDLAPAIGKKFTFMGYKRSSGEAGIRNELWIIPTVGCINGIGEHIAKRFREQTGEVYADNINVLKHDYGCSQLGDDLSNTRKVLADLVKHPNAGGVLVLSLGCENNTLPEFKELLGDYDQTRVRFLRAQDAGDEIAAGAQLLAELNEQMKQDKREELPLSALRVGLKCGGSDGLSGITANPLIGRFTDFITAQGGTAVLTEVPEMFGAETILMERAKDEAVFDKTVHLINNFKQYFISNGQPVYENPSPGNKEGGITTLEEKALGCTQKSGNAVVTDVLKYGDRLSQNGLNLLSAPGNDLVASSALAAAGCQLVLFSTGRGTPFGTVVPTLKISTNTPLYEAKSNWIDFNAGSLIEGKEMNTLLEGLSSLVLETASGKQAHNETNGFRDLAIWKTGVTL